MPPKPRLLVLSQYYRPEPNFITADVADAVSDACDVTVICALPNYPTGRRYEGWRGWLPRRSREGALTVWRLPLIPYHGNSLLRRGLCYASFSVLATILAPFLVPRPDIIWVYQTPFTTALAGLWGRYLCGAHLVYTAADLWPESLLAAGVARRGPMVHALFAYSRWINRHAHLIIASTQGMLERFAADGVPQDRLVHIPVWVDASPGVAMDTAPDPSLATSIVYVGNLGPSQRVDTLIRAGALLQEQGMPVRIQVFGSGASESGLRTLAADIGASNVVFGGRISPNEALRVSAGALAQVVSLQPSSLFAMTVPSKLAFAFAAGAPVLYGLRGEAARIAAESGGGIVFSSEDPASLVAAVHDLLQRTPEERLAMRAALRRHYNTTFAKPRLLARYRELLVPSVDLAGPPCPAS